MNVMPTKEPSPFYLPLCRLARQAGLAIKEAQRNGAPPTRKEDGTPVTAADEIAEALILDGLAKLSPDLPVVAEEQAAAGNTPKVGERFWLVDALDGTREFIRGEPSYTVNIALVEHGVPSLGVVHLPALDITYYGDAAGALRLEAAHAAERIQARRPPEEGLVVMESRNHGSAERLAEYLQGHKVQAREALGSSWKICRIAEGTADLYPRFGPTMEWDIAAAQAVLLAAGGHILTLDGAPLFYGKPDFRNPEFIARGL